MAMSDHTKIPKWVKTHVWLRDGERCVVCKCHVPIEAACSHVVRRSQGGMGIPENIVCHCSDCHRMYDNHHEWTRKTTREYIEKLYPGWTAEGVTYHRYKDGLKSKD